MDDSPRLVCADGRGRIVDRPDLAAVCRSARSILPLDPAGLIPLPAASRLYFLPGRRALGLDAHGMITPAGKGLAVAAFLPPGYVALALAAFESDGRAPNLPLYCYCAVCWYRGRFQVPALRVDRDPRHDPARFNMQKVLRAVDQLIRLHPGNRLLAHHGLVCVKQYSCPNAANLFLGRWEAPAAVSGQCNASCLGCISSQDGAIPPPHKRLDFTPTVAEITEIAVPHLEKAPRAMISFGQGCEGEPLLKAGLIEEAIRAIRRKTKRGLIHLNTNGSMPEAVERLATAGLDSIRVSLNSARRTLYHAYYRCQSYSFADVVRSIRLARRAGLRVAVNYLTFPGVTDDPAEVRALERLLDAARPHMIQWRNLNIDPDLYMDVVDRVCPTGRRRAIGLPALMDRIRADFPDIRQGYFNYIPPD